MENDSGKIFRIVERQTRQLHAAKNVAPNIDKYCQYQSSQNIKLMRWLSNFWQNLNKIRRDVRTILCYNVQLETTWLFNTTSLL